MKIFLGSNTAIVERTTCIKMMPMELYSEPYSEPDIAHFRAVCRSVRILLTKTANPHLSEVFRNASDSTNVPQDADNVLVSCMAGAK
jgi:hypothetical protein